jgi:hypothetical protein
MSKWVCIKDGLRYPKKGDIVEGDIIHFGIHPDEGKIFYYINDGYNYIKPYWEYFIPYEKWLAEWREQLIKSVLDD